MRYIPIIELARQIFSEPVGDRIRKRLFKAHRKIVGMDPKKRMKHARRNGINKWSPFKEPLLEFLGRKCWYTETELVGAHFAIDHFRPISGYWWLTYDPLNYRIACPFANSPEPNKVHGCKGGKGDQFPLLPPGIPASGKNKIRIEKPIILDPCIERDCEMLVFEVDGRPILNPAFKDDLVARERVERSKILLNLDHPDFNAKREDLRRLINLEIAVCKKLSVGDPTRNEVEEQIKSRAMPNAPFSSAARYYLKSHRHLDWVEEILRNIPR